VHAQLIQYRHQFGQRQDTFTFTPHARIWSRAVDFAKETASVKRESSFSSSLVSILTNFRVSEFDRASTQRVRVEALSNSL